MVELIQELLLKNNCVIIPGFGAFIGNYNPAEIRLSENKIIPPTKNIAFNRMLQANDGLLTHHVANYYTIPYNEAEERVSLFAQECSNLLEQNKSLILKNIGKFIVDAQSNIQFQPFFTKNYWLDSFGLAELSLYPVRRLKDTQVELKENYQRIMHPELITDIVVQKKAYNKSAYWIAAFLAIAFITSSLGWNLHKNNPNINYSSLLSIFDNSTPKPIVSKVIKKTYPVSNFIENKIDTLAIVDKEIIPNIISIDTVIPPKNPLTAKTTSYILIGTFFSETRAEKLQLEAEQLGYSTFIFVDNVDALFRVTVALDDTEVSASIANIKSTLNPRAWIYCTK